MEIEKFAIAEMTLKFTSAMVSLIEPIYDCDRQRDERTKLS